MSERMAWALAVVTFLAGGGLGVVLARLGVRRELDRAYRAGSDDLDAELWESGEPAEFDRTDVPRPGSTGVTGAHGPVRGPGHFQVEGHAIYPELAALAAEDVPRPGEVIVAESSTGPGHPSPYGPNLTPAQRRRDKHKQRGTYQPGDLPDPPTDVGAWWAGELEDLLVDGQSSWLTAQLAEVAA